MLRVSFSNRFETLLDGLLDALADPPSSPFESQQLIVPSMAVRRKVELAIAERFGICANVEFSFLGQWLWRQIGRLVPVADVSPFSPTILVWRIHAILGDHAFVEAHPRLRNYLADGDARMRYELAFRVAALFDQYVTYRAEWLAAWLEGKSVSALEAAGAGATGDQRWQADLWRHIAHASGTGREHPAAAFFDAIAAAGPQSLRDAGIPQSAHVFCLPSIPPLYLEMLRRLSRVIDVRLSALNPCREYWLDTVDRRRLSYLAAQGTLDYHEVGNTLLASWGKERKAQLALLFDDQGEAQLDLDRFEPSPGRSILARVQNAILDLRDLEPASLVDVAPDDRSVEVHVCHSLTRELEVLHDYLLALFAGGHPPHPSDILVVTPALDDAAPLIDAVFGTASAKRRIPYVVTGRGRSGINPAARALLDVLAVAASRFTATAVMELVQQPIVARRFGLDAAALARIRAWIRVAGIRWGVDAKHRAQCDVPPIARHTFDDGLQRLYLGYALPSAAAAPCEATRLPFGDRLPAGDAQGSDALALGSFAAILRELERVKHDVARAKQASDWMQALTDVAATFLAPAQEDIEDLREVQAAIGELFAQMEAGSPDEPLPLDVVRTALEAALDDPARGGVPSGAVTFSAMSSLRNLPYRVICIVGMNDGAWPGNARPAEFDLMKVASRAGDRQRREDERNVFLDLLLAARERLYLSYTGRSVRDNAKLPPSVLVAELLDCLVPALAPARADAQALAAAHDRLVVGHPLQPFSVDCFAKHGDPRIRSFNADYCDALRRQLEAQRRASASAEATTGSASSRAALVDDELLDEDEIEEQLEPFFPAPLPLDGDEWRSVTLEALAQFFRNPCSYLLRKRLRVRLDEIDEELQDDEPLVADFGDRHALAQRLLPLYLRNAPHDEIRALARAGTEYPPGRLGERLLERELAQLDAFARDLTPALAEPLLPPLEATISVPLEGETWQVSGEFGNLRRSGVLRYRYGDAYVIDYLDGWLSHVFLNLLAPAGVDRATTWHSRDGHYVLPPIDDAKARLEALVRLYRRGLTEPLHFFPRSAWEYACNAGDLNKAAGTWQGHPSRRGEKDHPSYRLALRGVVDPLDQQFEECAQAVLVPLRACIVDPRLE
jgi:exodeoxyribonuclease V gamma subunit